ncbi:MAG TPA: cytochrome ubiquinol oxidase subunit I [candidate division Zixibacteria bacterium]|nr:cytochrome ubiquinol oxidase subunit I [candidate division Zixibacteria bacterium]
MDYPFWNAPIGYGLLMAGIAVIHVFVSHFAIGGGLYLVISEHRARKAGDTARLGYLERLSKFFILLTLVFGAVSGVGIWFIIGLLNPAATEKLIHTFVWVWAIEWCFFVIEIAAAMIYYYGWKRLSAREHLIVGWVYFGAAWMSLFVINGIVTFMLTPGEWLTTGELADGFFNPTFWPSLVIRTGICIMLAGLFTSLVAVREKAKDSRPALLRYNAVWTLVGALIVAPSFSWYFNSLPAEMLETVRLSMPSVVNNWDASYWYAGVIAALAAIFGLALPRLQSAPVAALALLVGLGWFARFEMVREEIRKPFVLPGVMYANGIKLADAERYREHGLLPSIAYRSGNDARDLAFHACRSCHTLDGYRPVKPALDGAGPEFIAGTIRGAHTMVGNMPPFVGTSDEADSIAHFLWNKLDQRPLPEIYGLQGVELGAKVFEVRCGNCHVFGGHNDNYESITGLAPDEYDALLDELGELVDEMPPLTGDDVERAALIEFLQSLPEDPSEYTGGSL